MTALTLKDWWRMGRHGRAEVLADTREKMRRAEAKLDAILNHTHPTARELEDELSGSHPVAAPPKPRGEGR